MAFLSNCDPLMLSSTFTSLHFSLQMLFVAHQANCQSGSHGNMTGYLIGVLCTACRLLHLRFSWINQSLLSGDLIDNLMCPQTLARQWEFGFSHHFCVPLHDALLLGFEWASRPWFSRCVCQLMLRLCLVCRCQLNVLSKIVHLDIDVLCSGMHLWQSCHLQCPRIIFKHLALDSRDVCRNRPSQALRFGQ